MYQNLTEEAADISDLLETAIRRIQDGDVFDAMEGLLIGLDAVRRSRRTEDWRAVCERRIRQHPIFSLVHQAPFTRRAFDKPRGYPGDAVTLDYIYGLQSLGEGAPAMVRDLYAWEFQTPSCRGVRARKELLADHIDLSGTESRCPRILSLACGHVREGRDADVLLDRRVGGFFAVDPDAKSLAVVDAELGPYGVETILGSVRSVLSKKVAFRNLDLAYAAGLYDYLSDPVAIQLTARLFAMLRPGGRLLVPNFNPSLRDIGYLEAFMDWWLIYRDDAAMMRLLGGIPEGELADVRLFRVPNDSITVIEVTRR